MRGSLTIVDRGTVGRLAEKPPNAPKPRGRVTAGPLVARGLFMAQRIQ